MTWDTDKQFTSEKLSSVEASDEGWNLGFDGAGIFCTNEHCKQAPAVGETARLYGKGFGFVVRGIVIEGRVYRYQTEEENAAEHAAWCDRRKAAAELAFEQERSARDARRAALPEAFQRRLEAFSRKPGWRAEFEPYELNVCETAARLAAHFGHDVEALRAFSDKPDGTLIEGLGLDAHSGNSWGASVGLAAGFMRQPDNVTRMHGALCPLVGCSDYGCHAAKHTT